MAIFAPKKTKKSMKTLILTLLLVLICVILLGVRVLFVKGGKFPDGHTHSSAALRRKGIGCSHGDRDAIS